MPIPLSIIFIGIVVYFDSRTLELVLISLVRCRTIMKATPGLSGILVKSVNIASSPPEDAPIPTTNKSFLNMLMMGLG
jgi:hypothetical protein